ncbi:voltage-gated ion channel superfamily [Achlya hypogyna]|uniref:Voltage-gated ion channel superfamily n=1 Tax=Achlya hypogyna TaxID=1202772 RepID=A0A1V9ZSY2_ACHHY|nr:voltage-gated ion channel superfamily [Achlya hypogyna]
MRALVKAVQIARFIPMVEEDRRKSLFIDVLSETRRRTSAATASVVAKTRRLSGAARSSMFAVVRDPKRYTLQDLRENNPLVNRTLLRRRMPKATPRAVVARPYAAHKSYSACHPKSNFRAGWDLLLIGLLLYTAIAVPLEIAFATTEAIDGTFVVNRLMDVVFAIDCSLNFVTPYVDPATNQLVDDLYLVASHYLQGWFALDVVSIVPYDLISWSMAASSEFTAAQTQNVKVLRLMRVLRILKLTRVFRASRIIKRWNAVLGFPIAITQLGKYALVIIILAHWMACLWGCVPQYEDSNWNWEVAYGVNGSTAGTLYVASLYWSVMTIGTIGYGDLPMATNTEKVVAIVCMTVGCASYSFVVGSVCGLVSSLDESATEFNQQMDHLNTYMEREDIPPEMVFRLREYFLHRRDLLLHKHFSRVVGNLSPGLQGELSVYTAGEWVEMIPFFMGGPPGEHVRFITAISQRLEAELYPPQELITRAGEHSGKMYIISKGTGNAGGDASVDA